MSNLPKGKGFFIWVINELLKIYGSNEQVAEMVKALGIDWVQIKIAQAGFGYNWRWNGKIWIDDLVQPLTDAFKAVGIDVWGWHYITPSMPKIQANLGIKRTIKFGLDGYIANAEAEYKDHPNAAEIYCGIIREQLHKPFALTSYRYPNYHPRFPWHQFARYIDFWIPQVYWQSAHNPAEQLQRSIRELKAIRDLPIVPAGAAYQEHNWKPSAAEMNEFHEAVISSNLVADTWWELWRAAQIGVLDVIAAHEWPDDQGPGDDPPDPTDDEAARNFGALEALGNIENFITQEKEKYQ